MYMIHKANYVLLKFKRSRIVSDLMAITTTDYCKYKNGAEFDVELMRNHEESFDEGEVVGMDLRLGKSGANFENNVRNGVDRTAQIGEDNNALNSSITRQGAKLVSAITDRLDSARSAPWYDTSANYTYPNYPANDPRVMTIVVANPSAQDNSNPMIRTQLFITVYIEDIDPNAGNGNSKGNGRGGGLLGGGPVLSLRILPPQLYRSDRDDLVLGDDNTPPGSPAVVSLTDGGEPDRLKARVQ